LEPPLAARRPDLESRAEQTRRAEPAAQGGAGHPKPARAARRVPDRLDDGVAPAELGPDRAHLLETAGAEDLFPVRGPARPGSRPGGSAKHGPRELPRAELELPAVAGRALAVAAAHAPLEPRETRAP